MDDTQAICPICGGKLTRYIWISEVDYICQSCDSWFDVYDLWLWAMAESDEENDKKQNAKK